MRNFNILPRGRIGQIRIADFFMAPRISGSPVKLPAPKMAKLPQSLTIR
jgi:hypothetical protein